MVPSLTQRAGTIKAVVDPISAVGLGLTLLGDSAKLTQTLRLHYGAKIHATLESVSRPGWALAFDREIDESWHRTLVGLGAQQARDYLMGHGGVPTDDLRLRLLLRSTSNHRLLLRDVRPEVLERSSPLSTTLVTSPSAGMESATLLVYDLDAEEPFAVEGRQMGGFDRGDGRYFASHTGALVPEETLDLILHFEVRHHLVKWVIAIDFDDHKEERHTVRLVPAGGAFALTGNNRKNYRHSWLTGVAASFDEPLARESRTPGMSVEREEWLRSH